tara:strand:- start:21058 stop:21252 length:195 start_codon:yes stop_codon:yes gene_type:complete
MTCTILGHGAVKVVMLGLVGCIVGGVTLRHYKKTTSTHERNRPLGGWNTYKTVRRGTGVKKPHS